MAWLNLALPNQTVKNGLKAKDHIAPNDFFLKKQLIKFSCTYNPLSFCKIQRMWMCHYEDMPFLGPKWPICPEQFFLVQTIIITFISLLAPFIVQNFKIILTAEPKLWGCAFFLGPTWSICPKQIIFWKKIISFSSNYWPLSLCKIFKKFFL